MQMASGQFINPTACIPFEECPVRTPITSKKLTSLRVRSSLEHLRYTLEQNYVAIAQLLVWRLPSSTQPSSSVPQEFRLVHILQLVRLKYLTQQAHRQFTQFRLIIK